MPDDHPQANYILASVEKGWFQGYDDGTFRPDLELSAHQMETVVGRAFPDGGTRAEFAEFLWNGHQASRPDTEMRIISCYKQDDKAHVEFEYQHGEGGNQILAAGLHLWDGGSLVDRYSTKVRAFYPTFALLSSSDSDNVTLLPYQRITGFRSNTLSLDAKKGWDSCEVFYFLIECGKYGTYWSSGTKGAANTWSQCSPVEDSLGQEWLPRGADVVQID